MPSLKTPKSMPTFLPKENVRPLLLTTETPIPIDVPKKVTRHITRACGCGQNRSGCRWQIYFPEGAIVAVHEIIPFSERMGRSFVKGVRVPPPLPIPAPSGTTPTMLTSAQQCACYIENTRTNKDPAFTFIKKFAPRPRRDVGLKTFLLNEPFATDVKAESVACVVCKEVVDLQTGYNPKPWIEHRDACSAIENRIVRSTIDVWAMETSVSLMRR